ncbi:methyltransferase domain-containing protein [Priestia megaterium]|uniref:methyltransferase domain-containing protein n=1 Tax=Priestia megaterium TaxID=1404 RepID=UPI0025B00A3B|nr:methyltransferase domain-containing protein [Priestia megaterium]MDN3233370.1 methyltransferase domain-containing protein [Priestia megaterium]
MTKTLHERWYDEIPFWELGYRKEDVSTMGGPSWEVVEFVKSFKKGAKVLDLGCGEGRNALYLATQGFDVTAIDRSKDAIAKLHKMAAKAGVKVNAFDGDLSKYEITEEYDIVLAHGVLHWLANDQWKRLLTQAKENTRPGGLNIFTVKYFNEEFIAPEEFVSAGFANSFEPNEILDFYEGWETIRFDVYAKWDSHPGIDIHCHPVEKLVSRKPGNLDAPKVTSKPVPINLEHTLSDELFGKLDIGISTEKIKEMCGEPDTVDTVTASGLQYGAFEVEAKAGYILNFWYYGQSVLEIVDNKLRARNKYKTIPMQVEYAINE